MQVVPYLAAGGDYSDAFITADATESDLAALETLAAETGGDAEGKRSSSSGGCDVGIGATALIILSALFLRRHRR